MSNLDENAPLDSLFKSSSNCSNLKQFAHEAQERIEINSKLCGAQANYKVVWTHFSAANFLDTR